MKILFKFKPDIRIIGVHNAIKTLATVSNNIELIPWNDIPIMDMLYHHKPNIVFIPSTEVGKEEQIALDFYKNTTLVVLNNGPLKIQDKRIKPIQLPFLCDTYIKGNRKLELYSDLININHSGSYNDSMLLTCINLAKKYDIKYYGQAKINIKEYLGNITSEINIKNLLASAKLYIDFGDMMALNAAYNGALPIILAKHQFGPFLTASSEEELHNKIDYYLNNDKEYQNQLKAINQWIKLNNYNLYLENIFKQVNIDDMKNDFKKIKDSI